MAKKPKIVQFQVMDGESIGNYYFLDENGIMYEGQLNEDSLVVAKPMDVSFEIPENPKKDTARQDSKNVNELAKAFSNNRGKKS